MKPVYVAAYHQSVFGKLMGMTVPEIVANAVTGTCQEIGVDAAALDVASIGATCNISLNEQGLLAGLVAQVPGLEAKPIESVENACASGGQAVLSVDPEAAVRPRRDGHRGRLREDARRRGQDGRQARRQGARLLLPPRRAPGQGLRLPPPLRRGDGRLPEGPRRAPRSTSPRSRSRSTRTRSTTPTPRCGTSTSRSRRPARSRASTATSRRGCGSRPSTARRSPTATRA